MFNRRPHFIYQKTILFEKISRLTDKLNILEAKLENYNIRKKVSQDNLLFILNRKKFYRNLNTESHEIECNDDQIEHYWCNFWNSELKVDIEDKYFKRDTTEDSSIDLNLTDNDFLEIIKSLPDWKACGPDKIYNHFIKITKPLHQHIKKFIISSINNHNNIPAELCEGNTYLIPKVKLVTSPSQFRPISCMNTLYKLFTKIITKFLTKFVTDNEIISINQLGTVKNCLGAKEQAIFNNYINKETENKLYSAWFDISKAFDNIELELLISTLKRFKIPQKIINIIFHTSKLWKMRIHSKNKFIQNVNPQKGIIQGDSLSPLLFVLCIQPLSNFLTGNFEKIKINEELDINHLLFIDDIKIFSNDKEKLKDMIVSTQSFLNSIHLNLNLQKSATNLNENFENIISLGDEESYKYLGINETKNNNHDKSEMLDKLTNKIITRTHLICDTMLYSKNLITGLNEYVISALNYVIGLVNFEPVYFEKFDQLIYKILLKKNIINKFSCKERLYLPRKSNGRGLISLTLLSERILLKLFTELTVNINSLRRKFISEYVSKNISHIANISTFLKIKYDNETNEFKKIRSVQYEYLNESIMKKVNHSKIFINDKNMYDSYMSSKWLSCSNISPKIENMLTTLQDRNTLSMLQPMKCFYCHQVNVCVDHLATCCKSLVRFKYSDRHDQMLKCLHLFLCNKYKITKLNKISLHKLEKVVKNEMVEIRCDMQIETKNKVRYNKPDILVIDKFNKKITIVELGVTSPELIYVTESEKKRKYEDLKSDLEIMYGYETEIIPFVMSWDGRVSNYFKRHIAKLDLPQRIFSYIQVVCMKKTFEIVHEKGEWFNYSELYINDKDNYDKDKAKYVF
ncbi:Retrovirus-related Pol polyprotein from type-1 retrotransposable element R2 [Dictyocoela muelleri]|nr:Retrovirus-related Pol polyprotein from type-1 retrotransposable element R2 [Dictyocoela muelleri]